MPLDEDIPKGLLKTTSKAGTIIKVSPCHNMKCMHLTALRMLKLYRISAPSIPVACAAVPDTCLEVACHSLIASRLLRVHAESSALALFPAQILADLCIGISQVSASSVQGKIAAPAVASEAKTCHPDVPRINQDAATKCIMAETEQLPAPVDKHGKKLIAAACWLLVSSLPENVLQRCAAACQLLVASLPNVVLKSMRRWHATYQNRCSQL